MFNIPQSAFQCRAVSVSSQIQAKPFFHHYNETIRGKINCESRIVKCWSFLNYVAVFSKNDFFFLFYQHRGAGNFKYIILIFRYIENHIIHRGLMRMSDFSFKGCLKSIANCVFLAIFPKIIKCPNVTSFRL